MPGSADDLPLGVTEWNDLAVAEWFVDGVRGDGLVEVLGLAAARVAAGDRVGVRDADGDPGPPGLQYRVASDVVGVPVGVDDQGQLAGAGVHPVRGLAGVGDEAAVDQGRIPAGQQEHVCVGERPLLPGHPGRQAVRVIRHVLACLGLRLPSGRFGSPVCRAVLELLPVAAVRVLGVLAGHLLGKFGVEGVGEVGDVA